MNKLKSIIYSALLLPGIGLAQVIDIPTQTIPGGVTEFEGFLEIFGLLVTWIFTILLTLAVIFILFAAFQYLTAGGDDDKVKSAHQKIIYAVVAIAVAFLAQGVSFVVAQLLRSGGAGT